MPSRCSFRGLVHYRHGSMQADMVLEKELRVLHLDLQEQKETKPLKLHLEGIF